MSVDVDGLLFSFPDGWEVGKYDEFVFYRKHFSKISDGLKALDLIAIDPELTLWLIEVKDYSAEPRTKSICLADEVAQKILHTLAAMIPASIHATKTEESALAGRAARSRALRIVLHLELPRNPSKLFGRPVNPANIKHKIRQKLKCVDPHPVIARMEEMCHLQWSVARAQNIHHGTNSRGRAGG
jgi:hypothetical protein